METWAAEELEIASAYLDEHAGVLTDLNYNAVVSLLSTRLNQNRSAAGVKKKLVEMRRTR